ncbi:hypothetical protein L6164_000838 [Bauhinia variegata]|uniref:Uncharacterized protein n=1 Tax=Bauhinia variegata TaxID=167791 RepID=A0ACB9QAF5_BAUVA|nr:hypothetical protein L6164_000838 [Bauhinia variegata]
MPATKPPSDSSSPTYPSLSGEASHRNLLPWRWLHPGPKLIAGLSQKLRRLGQQFARSHRFGGLPPCPRTPPPGCIRRRRGRHQLGSKPSAGPKRIRPVDERSRRLFQLLSIGKQCGG